MFASSYVCNEKSRENAYLKIKNGCSDHISYITTTKGESSSYSNNKAKKIIGSGTIGKIPKPIVELF